MRTLALVGLLLVGCALSFEPPDAGDASEILLDDGGVLTGDAEVPVADAGRTDSTVLPEEDAGSTDVCDGLSSSFNVDRDRTTCTSTPNPLQSVRRIALQSYLECHGLSGTLEVMCDGMLETFHFVINDLLREGLTYTGVVQWDGGDMITCESVNYSACNLTLSQREISLRCSYVAERPSSTCSIVFTRTR